MKLRSIHLNKNRLFEDQAINLDTSGAATILVGPNNSGKTSVAIATTNCTLFATRSDFC